MTPVSAILHPPSRIHTFSAYVQLRAGLVSVKLYVVRLGQPVPCGFFEVEPVEWFTLERTFQTHGIEVIYARLSTEKSEDTTN
jgi:hypothetical protein